MSISEKLVIVKVVHPYSPVNNDELKLGKGDIITVTQKEDGGWWEGTLNGRTGWFPSNYVIEELSPIIPHSPFLLSDCSSSSVQGQHLKSSTTGRKVVAVAAHSIGSSSLLSEEQLKYRRMVLQDLIQSEEIFINELQDLWDNYLIHLPKIGILTTAESNILAGNFLDIIHLHSTLLLQPLRAEDLKPLKEQRIGRLFLDIAPKLETMGRSYCENHPKAAQILENHSEALISWLESIGAGPLTLLTGLSQPFRRFERYPALLQEVERHVEESHRDRGDLQRSVEYYKEIDKSCGVIRKQKEMELEVLSGSINGWEGSDVSQLGEIIHMNLVHIGQDLQPRYFVLFANTLLILSYNSEQNSLGYEGKIPVSGISLLPMSDKNKHLSNAFEIAGPMIEGILVTCGTKGAKETWISHLTKILKINRFPSFGSSPVQSFGQLTPPLAAWSISRLRPNPPTNPAVIEPQHLTNGTNKSTPTKGNHYHTHSERSDMIGGRNLPPQLTNEEDLTILSIVDAFCSANRQTTGGGRGGDVSRGANKPLTLADLVFSLRDEVSWLKNSMNKVTNQLEEEQLARKTLQTLVQAHVQGTTAQGHHLDNPTTNFCTINNATKRLHWSKMGNYLCFL